MSMMISPSGVTRGITPSETPVSISSIELTVLPALVVWKSVICGIRWPTSTDAGTLLSVMICGRLSTCTRDLLTRARIRMLIDSLLADSTSPGKPSVALRASHAERTKRLPGQRSAGGQRRRLSALPSERFTKSNPGSSRSAGRRAAVEQQRVLNTQFDSHFFGVVQPDQADDDLDHDHGRPTVQVLNDLRDLLVVLRCGTDDQRVADDFRHDEDLLVDEFKLADQRELLLLLVLQQPVLLVEDGRQGIGDVLCRSIVQAIDNQLALPQIAFVQAQQDRLDHRQVGP